MVKPAGTLAWSAAVANELAGPRVRAADEQPTLATIIVVVSNWILLPLIKGQVFGQANQVLFNGWDPQRMLAVAVIIGGFGLGLGIIYGLIGPRDRTA